MQIDIPAFEDFADGDQGRARITAQVVKQANELVVSVYANMGDMFEGANLGKLRVHTFLNNKSTLLTLLYRPRRAHAALASTIDKSAHIYKPNVEPREDYGWTVDNGYLMPVQSTRQAWSQQMMHTIPCGCTKGCCRNCSCAKKNIACYLGCRYQGSKKCGRARYTAAFDNNSDADSDN